MPISLLQHFSERYKRLDISSRSYHLYHDIESRRGLLSRGTTKGLRYIWRGRRGLLEGACKLALQLRYDELGEATVLLVDADVDSTIVGDDRVRAKLAAFVMKDAWVFGIGRWGVVGCRLRIVDCSWIKVELFM